MLKENNKIKLDSYAAASYTVEMSLLLPIILVFIFLIIYMIFYEHDSVKCEAILYEQARWKEQEFLTNKFWKYENAVKKLCQEKNAYKKGFFLVRLKSFESSSNMFNVKEHITMDSICSNLYIKSIMKEIGITCSKKRNILLYNPSEILRVYDGLSECLESESSWDYKKVEFEKIKDIFN